MAVRYTPEQKFAINKRNADILVSAAAGSGKTAVLVERILARLTDNNDSADIDSFLCLTFTEAAASEMREKIYNRIVEYTELHPEDEKMLSQLKRMRSASISTIDSFVGSVVKSHYHLVYIDPNYRIITGGEITQLQLSVIDELFKAKYAEKNADFFDLIEHFCPTTSDIALKNLILQVYRFASSMPYPKKWLDKCANSFDIEKTDDISDTVWGSFIKKKLKTDTAQITEILSRCIALCEKEDISYPKISDLAARAEISAKLIDSDITRLYAYMSSEKIPNFTNTDAKKTASGTLLKHMYDTAQELFGKTVDFLARLPLENWRENILLLRSTTDKLVNTVKEFYDAYSEEKRKNRLAEFDDIAHYALDILVDKDGKPTAVAKTYKERFKEIIIDEYQDCSFIQDSILEAVSRRSENAPNRFMVGDIKQCIYKFRKANPEIFADKYEKFSEESENECLIQLNKNFRSRKNILDTTNFFFFQLMSKAFGDVDYNESTALNCGADYTPIDKKAEAVELCYINTSGISEDADIESVIGTENKGFGCEAVYTASRIRDLLDDPTFVVEDTKTKIRRRIEPRDIVILLRKRAPIPVFADILQKYGIPVITEQSISLFETLEVQLLTSYLKIIDNPLQDTELVSVLFSAAYGLTAEELVKIYDKNERYFYNSVAKYNADDETAAKIRRFLNDVKRYKYMSKQLVPLGELVETIYRETGLYACMALLSGGEQRKRNLDTLLGIAFEYDNIDTGDLYGFISYLDGLAKTGMTAGSGMSAQTNSVVIMTMHQSKGLEFPVVFLPQMCASFRRRGGFSKDRTKIQDSNSVILNQDLGIGMKLIDPEERTISNTLTNLCVDESNELDSMHENLRLLYVGMTRAKEKLYMVGATRGTKAFSRAAAYTTFAENTLPCGFMQNADTYMDWLLTAYGRSNHSANSGGSLYYNSFINDFDFNCNFYFYDKDSFGELIKVTAEKEAVQNDLNDLFSAMDGYIADKNEAAELLGWIYPYIHIANLPSKTSISEIKHRYYEENAPETDVLKENEREYKAPEFDKDEQPISGASRGTLYHSFMEHIDFNIRTYDEINTYRQSLIEKGIMTEKETKLINDKKIHAFLESEICKRIAKSAYVRRETAFTLGLTPYEIYGDEVYKDDKELIHVDGIIDLFFEENDGIVLLDYKTDHIENGNVQPMTDRYKIQLDLYAKAIERSTGKKVKEKLLWLFGINDILKL
ncbi:MAG: helicase-exonuclease AddAB subunit AddA [Firmicutes bacterium]|nr:helicase-exonuclease AddAB subunit AddA [Bacillota bacterium]